MTPALAQAEPFLRADRSARPQDVEPGEVTWTEISPGDLNATARAAMAAQARHRAETEARIIAAHQRAMRQMEEEVYYLNNPGYACTAAVVTCVSMMYAGGLSSTCYVPGMFQPPQYTPEQIAEFRAQHEEHQRKAQEAADRGMKLLRSWLDPQQSEQYAKDGYFDVVGSRGTRYRITNGTAGNVHEFDKHGKQIASWCFHPGGALCMGDTMLAQKIALETDERAAIRVANKMAGGYVTMAILPEPPTDGREGFFERWFR